MALPESVQVCAKMVLVCAKIVLFLFQVWASARASLRQNGSKRLKRFHFCSKKAHRVLPLLCNSTWKFVPSFAPKLLRFQVCCFVRLLPVLRRNCFASKFAFRLTELLLPSLLSASKFRTETASLLPSLRFVSASKFCAETASLLPSLLSASKFAFCLQVSRRNCSFFASAFKFALLRASLLGAQLVSFFLSEREL